MKRMKKTMAAALRQFWKNYEDFVTMAYLNK